MKPKFNKEDLTLNYDYGDFGYTYKFESILHEEKTQFQTIRMMKHRTLGKTMLLDDDIMDSEYDSEYDNAVMSLLPTKPGLRILILGGGDCSFAAKAQYELNVRSIHIVEIDRRVPEIAAKYWPSRCRLGAGVRIQYDNALSFLNYISSISSDRPYDVVVDDMFTDPIPGDSFGISNYRKYVATVFSGIPIISQTDSLNSGRAVEIRKDICSWADGVQMTDRFVPTYLEPWTFTKYRIC